MNFAPFTSTVSCNSVSDTILQKLRFDIVRGVLPPQKRLRLEWLREVYGASVTTLREMLNRLVAEQLVVAEGQRGFKVAPIRISDLRELGEMRILLECHALRASLSAGSLNWEADVVSAHHMLQSVENILIQGDASVVEQWVKYDWSFHRAIVSACNSSALMATHANIFERYMRYHLLALDFRGATVASEHQRLRDLVVSRQSEAAGVLLKSHICAGMEHIIASGKLPD